MEIKTTNQIVYQDLKNEKQQTDKMGDCNANEFRIKKWVAVDDVKKVIDEYNKKAQDICKIPRDLFKQLED